MNLIYLYNHETKDLISTNNETFIKSLKEKNYIIVDEDFYRPILEKEKAIYKINELKELLNKTDWMIIVNSELRQQGLEIKYPEIYKERQSWREEINSLESTINE